VQTSNEENRLWGRWNAEVAKDQIRAKTSQRLEAYLSAGRCQSPVTSKNRKKGKKSWQKNPDGKCQQKKTRPINQLPLAVERPCISALERNIYGHGQKGAKVVKKKGNTRKERIVPLVDVVLKRGIGDSRRMFDHLSLTPQKHLEDDREIKTQLIETKNLPKDHTGRGPIPSAVCQKIRLTLRRGVGGRRRTGEGGERRRGCRGRSRTVQLMEGAVST